MSHQELLQAVKDGYTINFHVKTDEGIDEVFVDACGWSYVSDEDEGGLTHTMTKANINGIESVIAILKEEDWEIV